MSSSQSSGNPHPIPQQSRVKQVENEKVAVQPQRRSRRLSAKASTETDLAPTTESSAPSSRATARDAEKSIPAKRQAESTASAPAKRATTKAIATSSGQTTASSRGRKRQRPASPVKPESPEAAEKARPGKKRRQAAVAAAEGITNIANSGRRASSTASAKAHVEMGKDKGKGKAKAKEGEAVDGDALPEASTSKATSKKGESGPKEKAKGRKGKSANEGSSSLPPPAPRSSGEGSGDTKTKSKKRANKQSKQAARQGGSSNPYDDSYDEDNSDEEYAAEALAATAASRTMEATYTLGGGFGSSFGMANRFSEMLKQLKQKGDPTMQLVALQELSEILVMATEDMFIGHGGQRMAGFDTNEFVKALVDVLRGGDGGGNNFEEDIPLEMLQEMGMSAAELGFGGGGGMANPELILLACRCLSNLIEAHPSSTGHVLQHGAVDVLVGKLMEVEYIDLAEQVLAVLNKISVDYPSAIVRANGLLAVLQYIDFFGLHVQRTAVTIAANACQGLGSVSAGLRRFGSLETSLTSGSDADPSDDVFNKVKDVVPILERLLSYADSKLVEQTVRALDRIIEWCWKSEEKLEAIVTPSLLQSIITIITPSGTTSANGGLPAITPVFTKLTKVLVNIAKGSPKFGTALLVEYGLIDLIQNFMTGGVSTGDVQQDRSLATETVSASITMVVVSRPADQVLEVLRLASAVLPTLPAEGLWDIRSLPDAAPGSPKKAGLFARPRSKSPEKSPTVSDPMDVDHSDDAGSASRMSIDSASTDHSKTGAASSASHLFTDVSERRLKLLGANPDAMRKYVTVLLPTFIEVFGVTVNPNTRRAAVECVAKGIWYTDDPNHLGDTLGDNQMFGKFVPELLSLRQIVFEKDTPEKERLEAMVLVASGLQIASTVIDRCGERFKSRFTREGAMEEIAKIVKLGQQAKTDPQPESPTKVASSSHLPAPVGRRLSDLVRDLKRLRDQVAGHMGGSPASNITTGSASAGSTAAAAGSLVQGDSSRAEASEPSPSTDAERSAAIPTGTDTTRRASDQSDSGQGSDGTALSTSPGSSLLSGMRNVLERLGRSGGHPPSARASGNTTTLLNGVTYTEDEIRTWIFATAQRLLEKSTSSSSANQSGAVLGDLRRLGAVLDERESQKGELAICEALQGVARHFVGEAESDGGVGITSFELLESGIMRSFADFLSKPSSEDLVAPDPDVAQHTTPIGTRLKAFLHVFMNGPSPDHENRNFYVAGAFKALLQRLQECLSRVEQFDVATAVSSATTNYASTFSMLYGFGGATNNAREANNPSLQLTRQLKIKLVAAEPDTVPKPYQALMISVHAVATYKALEDYLKGRIVLPPGTEVRSENKQALAAEVKTASEDAPAGEAASDAEKSAESDVDIMAHEYKEGEEDELNEDDGEDEYDEEYDEDDDIDDDEMLDVSDLLLKAEETTRQRRRGSSITASAAAADAADPSDTGEPDTAASRRRDSVVDVRTDSPMRRPSTAGASSSRRESAALPESSSAVKSYASAVASSTIFNIEFRIDNTVIPHETTIFGSVFAAEQRKGVKQPNVWNQAFTMVYRKVWRDESAASATEAKAKAGASSKNTAAEKAKDVKLHVKLPFPTTIPEGVHVEAADGQVLYLLRLLYGLNSRWAEVYASEDAELDGFHEGGASSLSLQEGSQPMERVAVTSRTGAPVSVDILPPAAFANTKLTAKLNRQLDEPLIVASDVLPKWCASLAKEFSFLVPFETRLAYMQSTSFGYSRSIGRWQHQQNGRGGGSGGGRGGDGGQQLGRLQRQKVRIARQRLLDSTMKVMELYGSTQALLEVEFFDEVGTGLGPTLEFYSNVCREARRSGGVSVGGGSNFKVWRDDNGKAEDTDSKEEPDMEDLVDGEYLNPALGLFPAPMLENEGNAETNQRILTFFTGLGTFVAKALLDSRLVDLPFNPIFLEMVVGEEEEEEQAAEAALGKAGRTGAEFHLLRHVDPSLYKSLLDLKKYVHIKRSIESNTKLSKAERVERLADITVRGARLEDLCLDFTLPGYPTYELIENGAQVAVSIDNVEKYIDSVVEQTVGTGVARQVEAFRTGFDKVFPAADLRSFTVQELSVLVGGAGSTEEDWEYDSLMESIKADHGYTKESATIRNLVSYISVLTPLQRREFLQFVTGSPKLPIGGFKALMPPLTVVRKTVEQSGRTPDDYLPSVMTCVNYLKVPDYSDAAVMKKRFEVAVREGQGCFHLS